MISRFDKLDEFQDVFQVYGYFLSTGLIARAMHHEIHYVGLSMRDKTGLMMILELDLCVSIR